MFKQALSFLLLALSLPAISHALCTKKTCFKNSEVVGGETLFVRGVGLQEYLFFDVCSVAFYASESWGAEDNSLILGAKLLVVEYHRDLEKSVFVKSANKTLRKNPKLNLDKLKPSISEFHSLYKDVSKGDRYSLKYTPGLGTSLYLNGNLQGTIKGEEFARAYFGIWLSDYSLDSDLRSKLLGS